MWSKQFACNYNSAGRVQKGTRTSRLVGTRKTKEGQTEENEPHYYYVDGVLGKQGITTFKNINIKSCNIR